MKKSYRAAVEFALKWKSCYAQHNERFFADNIDFWRDIFPGNMGGSVAALSEGERCSESFKAGVLVPSFKDKDIVTFRDSYFDINQRNNRVIPTVGRFYPRSFAYRALNCFKGDMNPFRIVKKDQGMLVGDTNHPLAKFPLTLEAAFIEKIKFFEERGGSCNYIPEMVANNGPGMQIPYSGNCADKLYEQSNSQIDTDFYSIYPFKRENEDDDSIFYKSPKMVNHLDDTAISQVTAIYSKLLPSGCKVLDLMSSWVSHLPDSSQPYKVTGLGLNEEELKANRQLSDFVVHDLNTNPKLPFKDGEFDAVICTASIEYLIKPLEVIEEVARVVKSGGLFITTFSDRWFPGKQIIQWSQLHEFERLGLVLDYFIKSEKFENLNTESVRGLPRPVYDKHIRERACSDPIFAVWGNVKS
ncbi:MAG: class I SAM-dependent methyltransferase [Desulfamplus sp.]